MTEEIVCAICYDDDKETPYVEPHPCKCKGSRIHLECLKSVLKEYKKCGACNTKYTITRAILMRDGLQVIRTYHKRTITNLVENTRPLIKEEFTISEPGIKHGEYKLFDRKGNLIQLSHYNNNNIHGISYGYYPFVGQPLKVQYTINFDNGIKEGEYKTYYPNGQIEVITSFHNNKLHGEYTRYYANNQVMIKMTYVDGLKHGPCEHYYPRGQLNIVSHYLNGKLHGSYYDYKKDGTLNHHNIYDNGEEFAPIPVIDE